MLLLNITCDAFQIRHGLTGFKGLEAKSGTSDRIARLYSLNPTKSNTGYIARAHSNLLLNLTLRYPFPETCFGPNPLYAFFHSFSSAAPALSSFNPSDRVPTTLNPVSAPLMTNVCLISVRLRSTSSTARYKTWRDGNPEILTLTWRSFDDI